MGIGTGGGGGGLEGMTKVGGDLSVGEERAAELCL